jgi:hypothetical protein
MFRATICLVLVFQMLVPTAAIARLVGARSSVSNAHDENEPVASACQSDKVCCCTNKPGCHCCGEKSSNDQESDGTPSSKDGTRSAMVHCKCPDLDLLNLDAQFFGHLRPSCIERFDPPQVDTLRLTSDTYLSAYLAIDPHPPRHS